MLCPVLGDSEGQQKVMGETCARLRTCGHQVIVIGSLLDGKLPPNDGARVIPLLVPKRLFPRTALVEEAIDDLMAYLADFRPQLIHLTDQFDYRIVERIGELYPLVVTHGTLSPPAKILPRLVSLLRYRRQSRALRVAHAILTADHLREEAHLPETIKVYEEAVRSGVKAKHRAA